MAVVGYAILQKECAETVKPMVLNPNKRDCVRCDA